MNYVQACTLTQLIISLNNFLVSCPDHTQLHAGISDKLILILYAHASCMHANTYTSTASVDRAPTMHTLCNHRLGSGPPALVLPSCTSSTYTEFTVWSRSSCTHFSASWQVYSTGISMPALILINFTCTYPLKYFMFIVAIDYDHTQTLKV